MNCDSAEKLLSAERDETLGAAARAELDAHVAGCAACQKRRALLAESAAAWRTTTAEVRVSDERIEWRKIQRRLNGAADEPPAETRSSWNIFSLRGAAIMAAAAAVVLGVFFAPRSSEPTIPVSNNVAVAKTDTVEIGGDASTAMVYVDDQSGWLVVWAAGATGG